MPDFEVHKCENQIVIENSVVTRGDDYVNYRLTREQAEELYDRLDFILHDVTRVELECQLNDLQYRESKLKEAVAFGNRNV